MWQARRDRQVRRRARPCGRDDGRSRHAQELATAATTKGDGAGDGVARQFEAAEARRSHVEGRILRFVGFGSPAPVVGSHIDSITLVKVLDNPRPRNRLSIASNTTIDAENTRVCLSGGCMLNRHSVWTRAALLFVVPERCSPSRRWARAFTDRSSASLRTRRAVSFPAQPSCLPTPRRTIVVKV